MTKKSGSMGPDLVPAHAARFDRLFAAYSGLVPPDLRTASR